MTACEKNSEDFLNSEEFLKKLWNSEEFWAQVEQNQAKSTCDVEDIVTIMRVIQDEQDKKDKKKKKKGKKGKKGKNEKKGTMTACEKNSQKLWNSPEFWENVKQKNQTRTYDVEDCLLF